MSKPIILDWTTPEKIEAGLTAVNRRIANGENILDALAAESVPPAKPGTFEYLEETLATGIAGINAILARPPHADDCEGCDRCCDHEEIDHTTCATCGKDMGDDLAARAEFASECAGGE